MLTLFYNDVATTVAATTIATLLDELDSPLSCAIALNGEFIARQLYADTVLAAGDRVDAFVPMQGG